MLLGSLLSGRGSGGSGGGSSQPSQNDKPNGSGNNSGGSGSSLGIGCIVVVVAFILVVVLSGLMGGFGGCSSSDVPDSTVQREALPAGSAEETGYYTDEDGDWILTPSKLESGMRTFYNKTGVWPYLYILPNGSVASSTDLSDTAEELYYELFEDEAHFIFVFCDDGYGGYDYGYYAGTQTGTVIDSESIQIFLAYLEENYSDRSLSEEELFSNTYSQTASYIMQITIPPWVYAVIAAAVIVVAVVVFVLVRRRQQRKKEEAERMERIINTPLEQFDDEEVEDLAKEYEDAK